jgi:hypothetical protein
MGWAMLTREERDVLTDIQDRLMELFAERDEAREATDWQRVRELEAEINEARAKQKDIRRWDTVGTA